MLFVFGASYTLVLFGQQERVQVEANLRLGSLPQLAGRCDKGPVDRVEWAGDQRLLFRFSTAPCRGKGSGSYPLNTEYQYLVLDLHGNVLASVRWGNPSLKYYGAGTKAEFLASGPHEIQILDDHFKSSGQVPCTDSPCSFYLAEDSSGFAVCHSPDFRNCRYYRGGDAEAASAADFPSSFPKLQGDERPLSFADARRFAIGNGETWLFDRKCHLSGVRSDGSSFSIPNPITKPKPSCFAEVSRKAPFRLLAHIEGDIELGGELPLYAYQRLVLYDVASRTPIVAWNPGLRGESLSPDGHRVAIWPGKSRDVEIEIDYIP